MRLQDAFDMLMWELHIPIINDINKKCTSSKSKGKHNKYRLYSAWKYFDFGLMTKTSAFYRYMNAWTHILNVKIILGLRVVDTNLSAS